LSIDPTFARFQAKATASLPFEFPVIVNWGQFLRIGFPKNANHWTSLTSDLINSPKHDETVHNKRELAIRKFFIVRAWKLARQLESYDVIDSVRPIKALFLRDVIPLRSASQQ